MDTSIKQRIHAFLDSRSDNHRQRLRLITFMLLSTTVVALGIPMHIGGLIGRTDGVLYAISAVSWAATACLLAAFVRRAMSLDTAIATLGLTLQMAESARIAWLVAARPEGFAQAVVFNQIISLALIIYLVIAFVRYIPLLNTLLSLGTLVAAYACTDGAIDRQTVAIFVFVELFTCLLGELTRRGIGAMQRENTDYMATQNSLLEAFHMSKPELLAYIQLGRSRDMSGDDVSRFFDRLDERTEANLVRAVEQRMAQRSMRQHNLSELLPGLTPTETEVCRLVLGGKTLAEIAAIMGKNTNNISSVRIHIRKKLGLATGDDLRAALTAIIGDGKE